MTDLSPSFDFKPGLLGAIRFVLAHGRLPLRDRYWRRNNGRLRLRYLLASYAGASSIASFSALAFIPALSVPVEYAALRVAAMLPGYHLEQPAIPVIATLAPSFAPATAPAINPEQVAAALTSFRDAAGQIRRSAETRATVALVHQANLRDLTPPPQRLTIAAGDTLSSLLLNAGVSNDDAQAAIKAMRTHMRPGDLRPGQVMNLERQDGARLHKLTLAIDPVRTLEVKAAWGGRMTAAVTEKPLKRDVGANVAVIRGSLYGAASAAGVPSGVTAEAIKALSHQIDFQRDIQPGDRLEIMYDRMVTDDGYVARTGNLIFAKLYADGRELSIYRFETRDGRIDYFDQKGNSIRKALLRTPMDGARLTSGFGMRRHPILGYSKMHKGVDFGATTGTPIYAAGDAVVEKAGRFGAYGNYVRLRHTSKLQTAYAHLSRYGPGIRPGVRVRQGQVIGYVGSTGRSTGPHLHYEIMVNGQHVNPQSVKLPTMVTLEGPDLKKFRAQVETLDRQFKDRVQGVRYAAADTSALSSTVQ